MYIADALSRANLKTTDVFREPNVPLRGLMIMIYVEH